MIKTLPGRIALGALVVVAALACVCAVSLAMLRARTDALRDDYTYTRTDARYSEAVSVDGIEVITQQVSCGYAVIQMFSAWDGGSITEKSLLDEHGSVVTSTGQSFCDEMNHQIPTFKTTMRRYLRDSELLTAVHDSIANGVPVPVEWAAKSGSEWTLHYSLVTGIDMGADRVTVANPYGYVESVSLSEFLNRTRFDAYENMPLFLQLGFAFDIFEKNTVFVAERVS